MNNPRYPRTAEKGAALLIGLILLLVATLVGVAAMQGSQFQEKMASNHYNKAVSFHAAEVGATRFVEAINKFGLDGETWQEQLGVSNAPSSPDPVVTGDGFGWYYVDEVQFIANLGSEDGNSEEEGNSEASNGVSEDIEFSVRVVGLSRAATIPPTILGRTDLQVLIGKLVIPPGGGGPSDAAINLVGKLKSFEVPNSGALEVCNLEDASKCTNQIPDEEKIAVGPAVGVSAYEGVDQDADYYAKLIADGLESNEVLENYHGEPAVAVVDFPDLWTKPEAMRAFVNRACAQDEEGFENSRCSTDGTVPANTVVNKNAAHTPNLTVIRGPGETTLDFRGGNRGEGILVVEGTLRTRGTPNWDGIIIVLGGEFHITGGGSGGVNGTLYLLNLDMSTGEDGEWTHAVDEQGNEVGVTFKSDGGGNAKFNHNCEKIIDSLRLLDYQDEISIVKPGNSDDPNYLDSNDWLLARAEGEVDETETRDPNTKFLAGDWLSNAHGCDPAGGTGTTTEGSTVYSIVKWKEVLR